MATRGSIVTLGTRACKWASYWRGKKTTAAQSPTSTSTATGSTVTATTATPAATATAALSGSTTAVTVPETAAPAAPARPVPAHVYSVRDFGAKGDGTTDDYDAVQAAIDACGSAGGEVLFPAGTYYLGKQGAGGLKLRPGNVGWLVLSGYGATIKLSANVPRFLDFSRTADYQTFSMIWVEGFAIDANHVATQNHVIGFTYINGNSTCRFNANNIMVRDVHAYDIATGDTAGAFRVGVQICTYQWGRNEPVTDTIRDIYCENVTLEGGSSGFWIGGMDYSGLGWPADSDDTNIDVDNVQLTGCTWDSGVRGVHWCGNGMLMGIAARCGSLYVKNCDFRGSGDNNYEVDGWHYALLQNCVSEDAYYCGYFFSNIGWPQGGWQNQNIVWKDCVNRDGVESTARLGWAIGRHNPEGTLTFDGCSETSTNAGASGASFISMLPSNSCYIKGLTLHDCSYTAGDIVISGDSYPAPIFTHCDGTPDGTPTKVVVDGCSMYLRSRTVGSPAYYVRLLELAGANCDWTVENSQFDAAVTDGASAAIEELCFGDVAFPSAGSGVVSGCKFVTAGVSPRAIAVGASSTLNIGGTIDVTGCSFSGCSAIWSHAGDANGAKVIVSGST